jgi:hypothetical protein
VGSGVPRKSIFLSPIGQPTSSRADGRLLPEQADTSQRNPSAKKLPQPYQRQLFLLSSDLAASTSRADSPGRPHVVKSSAMQAPSTSENGQAVEGALPPQSTKSSKQRFKPQLSCTFCRNRKCVHSLLLASSFIRGPATLLMQIS